MWNLIISEWKKLRRCQILLVGIVALALCPAAQYGTQLLIDPALRDPHFDFARLFASVIWGNTQIFLPISLVMTGGWLIDRERSHDTMKNLLTVPVSYPKLLTAKLAVMALLALLAGIYSSAATVLIGILAGVPGLSPLLAVRQGMQVTAAALTTYLACTPLILLFGQLRNAYLGGSILTFFLAYCILFFKSGVLLSAYPFCAALVLTGFDMAAYNGAAEPPSVTLALIGMEAALAATAAILLLSRPAKNEKAARGRRTSGEKPRYGTAYLEVILRGSRRR